MRLRFVEMSEHVFREEFDPEEKEDRCGGIGSEFRTQCGARNRPDPFAEHATDDATQNGTATDARRVDFQRLHEAWPDGVDEHRRIITEDGDGLGECVFLDACRECILHIADAAGVITGRLPRRVQRAGQ